MLLSLIFALGGNTPFYRLFHLFPPFNSIRYPVKFIFLFIFLVAVTAGLGFDSFQRGVSEESPRLKRVIIVLFYIGFFFVILWGYFSLFGPGVYRYFESTGFKPDAYNNISINIHNIKRFLLFSFLFCLMPLIYLRVRFKRTVSFVIMFVLVLDLFLANNGYYTSGSWKFYIDMNDRQQNAFLGKVSNAETARYFVSFKTLKEFTYFPYDRIILSAPYASLFDLYSLGGAEVLRLRHHETFSTLLKDSPSIDNGKRFLYIAGVRYLTTSYAVEDSDFTLLETIETMHKTAYLYEYNQYAGRFSFFGKVHVAKNDKQMIEKILDRNIDPRRELIILSGTDVANGQSDATGRVKLVSYGPSKVQLDCEAHGDGFLFLSDTYYPGWKAYVDGKDSPIYRANLAFRAVRIPKGHHAVAFVYKPISFYAGLLLTVLGILALLGIVLWDRKKARDD
jgi:hypothetical protein